MITLGSFFDGVGTWQLSASKFGINPVWCSEIDEFPAAVSKHHFPSTKQLGDITKLTTNDLDSVDIICAGSPCQDLSVAGKRAGLAGERSGLFVDSIKLVHGLRTTTGKPRFFVWENVPGAFSSNKGMDFKAVLEEITKTEIPMPKDNKWAEAGMVEWDGGSLAWRTLDAQYWGVPQRRKRIFLVADFTGKSAGEILFIEQGLPGHTSESQREGQEIAANVGESINSAVVRMRAGCEGGGKGALVSKEKSLTLGCSNDQALFTKVQTVCWETNEPNNKSGGNQVSILHCLNDQGGKQMNVTENKTGTLRAEEHGHQPIVVGFYPQKKAESMTPMIEKSPCLVNGTNPGWQNGVYCVGNGQVDQTKLSDKVGALNCMHDQQCVMTVQKTLGALQSSHYKGERNGGEGLVTQNKTVRRLTPTECERLQGLPDGYTNIDFNGKPAPDSKRYKAIGNGMAVPCSDFIMKRIVEVMNEQT